MFRHTCKMGLEGIAGLALQVGTFAGWLKFKNPNAAAVERQAEEDWGK